jgi:hypothetical protein
MLPSAAVVGRHLLARRKPGFNPLTSTLITPLTSDSMARRYQRAAEAAEKGAATEDGKVATLSTKLGRLDWPTSSPPPKPA